MSLRRTGHLAFRSVWKRFRKGERADSLRDLVPAALRRAAGWRAVPTEDRHFWALRDVSFEVTPGTVLGVIGQNGAGKSTLLKLASGILEPSSGTVEIRGRVGALIEVAAGFHPDLTGRENVFLQGAVMGMTRGQIRSRLHEIVEFSGVSDFLDTPVKRYSSGMAARLGFAIAAHLDPDVLLIDEVLSVGDLAFQAKAVGRLREIVDSGIPVVIVSHQLERIIHLCDEVVLLDHGSVARRGEALEVVAAYVDGDGRSPPHGIGWVVLDEASVEPGLTLQSGESICVTLRGSLARSDVGVGLRVRSVPEGKILFSAFSGSCGVRIPLDTDFQLRVTLDMNLGPGLYGLQPYMIREHELEELWRGKTLLVRVERDATLFGQVDLNARMRLGS